MAKCIVVNPWATQFIASQVMAIVGELISRLVVVRYARAAILIGEGA